MTIPIISFPPSWTTICAGTQNDFPETDNGRDFALELLPRHAIEHQRIEPVLDPGRKDDSMSGIHVFYRQLK